MSFDTTDYYPRSDKHHCYSFYKHCSPSQIIPRSTFLLEKLILDNTVEKFTIFMKSDGLLSCSLVLATGPHSYQVRTPLWHFVTCKTLRWQVASPMP